MRKRNRERERARFLFSRTDVAIRYGNALPELPELFVNGLRVDKEQVHLHTMLAFFRTEMSLTRDLALASGLTSKQASRAIAQARPELSGGAGESEEDGAKSDSTAESLRRSLAPHTRVCSALDDAGVQVRRISISRKKI